MGKSRKIPLADLILDRRDDIIAELHAKKKFVIDHQEPHGAIRAEGFNSGLDEAIKVFRENI